MTRQRRRELKLLSAALGTGLLFGGLTCVQNIADTLGTGLVVTGITGVLGPDSTTATNVGVGLDFLADFLKFVPR